MERLLETFALDLSEMSEEPFLLILDEYDRSDSADDVQMFIERLVDIMPEHCRLVLNSRTLPRLPWVSLIAQKHAVLLQDDRLISQDFYDIATEGENQLQVFALGPGYILMNGESIDNWEGHLPRLLFFFALDRPSITRSEICQAFWPELVTDQAVNVFHVTKRRLHKALDMDVLIHDDGYYRVNPDLAIHYDVMDFVSTLMAGRDEDNPDRMEAWGKAIELYRGPFLQGHSDPWIVERRKDFQAGYLEALTEMARVRLAEDRPEHAWRSSRRRYQRTTAAKMCIVKSCSFMPLWGGAVKPQRITRSWRKSSTKVGTNSNLRHKTPTSRSCLSKHNARCFSGHSLLRSYHGCAPGETRTPDPLLRRQSL